MILIEKLWLIVFDNVDGDDKGQLFCEFCFEVGCYGLVLIIICDVMFFSQSFYSGIELGELIEEEVISFLFKLMSYYRSRG